MKTVTIHGDAQSALKRMPANWSKRVLEKIRQYAGNPTSLANNVKRLQGRPELRLRVGDWRVLFVEDAESIQILAIASRGDAYK